MVNLYRITNPNDKFFHELFELYSESFPENERRSQESFVMFLNNKKEFCVNALLQNDLFVGLLNYWIFEDFFYIEHFALSPDSRNQRIGTNVIAFFKSQINLPVVLEVEMPDDVLSIRRIKFYKNLGFFELHDNYMQPPYESGGSSLPMMIMCDDLNFGSTNFERIKETLYREVYRCNVVN